MLRSIQTVAVVVAGLVYATTVACSSNNSNADSGTSSSSGSGGGSGGNAGNCDTGGDAGVGCSSSVKAFVPCLTGSALLSPNVSFKTDVQPILNSCGTAGSTCHGAPNDDPAVSGLIYLGKPGGGAPASAILPNIVGKASPEDPKMNIIQAGDPENSYLMHKLDGDQCIYSANCSGAQNPTFTNCGSQMPFNGPYLDQSKRDAIRRWIAQGAQDD